MSLSLGSATVMEFWRDGEKRPLLLPPRSLLVMSGECRYAWCDFKLLCELRRASMCTHMSADRVNVVRAVADIAVGACKELRL